jgi:DNA invertase Pin-like site-specific DNA recombinase
MRSRIICRPAHWTALLECVEVESGKNRHRPELEKAFSACRVHGAALVIAKLDRLSRDASFLMSIQRHTGVDVICVDQPNMGRAELGMRAVFAEEERRWISERTRSALAAAKRRGVVLGTPANLTRSARLLGSKAGVRSRIATAELRAQDLAPTLLAIRRAGLTSLRAIATALNAQEIPAARGGVWSAAQVQRLIDRVGAAQA